MEYAEYKKILDEAMVSYVNNGGSVFYMGSVTKEYIFSYDNDMIPYDHKDHLNNKAIQAIMQKQKLPSGISLEKCIWYGKDR